ncbi:MAG TPA: RIP metalloprotease RseP [Methylophilus sp.]
MMTILAFIVTIGVLVTIHEYGHFQVARWCNVRVLKFSIGFGQPLWTTTFGKDKTEFILAAIPLGGYVKMLDERELQQERENPELPTVDYTEAELERAFNRKSVYQRMAIVLAGPVANLLLAIALYWLLFMMGMTGLKPIVGEVQPASLASQAQFASGDLILTIQDEPIKTWQEARWLLLEHSLAGKPIQVVTSTSAGEQHSHTLTFDGIDHNAEVDVLQKLGMQMMMPDVPAVIGEVLPNSAAEKMGLQAGDKVLAIDQVDMQNWDKVVNFVRASPNKSLQFKIARQQQEMLISVIPEAIPDQGKTIGRLGASALVDQKVRDALMVELDYTPLQSLKMAALKTWDTSLFSLKMLGNMVTGKVSWKGISGPVSIASFAGESANLGLKVFLGFLALVSISIGVLNLLPIPVLDGGHLMYYIVEVFKGSPVSEQVMLWGQKIGFALLGLLMMVALFNDINRFMIG